jgi:hypothetical protein
MKQKGQTGIRAVFITLIVAGILALVSVLIFSKVNHSITGTFDQVAGTIDNETAAATTGTFYDSLSNKQMSCALVTIWNATGFQLFNSSSYTTNGCAFNLSCDLADDTQCIAANGQAYNVLVSYTYSNYTDTAAVNTFNNLGTTVLDSFELAVIALIVMAAVAILGVLFVFGGK